MEAWRSIVLASWGAALASCLAFDSLTGGDEAPVDASSDATFDDGGSIADGALDAASDATSDGPCPSGRGPEMIAIGEGVDTFCIDSTEVTRKQYDAFLASGPTASGLPPQCAGTSTFTPTLAWPLTPSTEEFPVIGVSWCEALAFCNWSGKRLCGNLQDGGAGDYATGFSQPSQSEWMNACTAGGTFHFDAAACNEPSPDAAVAAVESFPGCMGGYAGIYDMEGNVYEWSNECNDASVCHTRGSSCFFSSNGFGCGDNNGAPIQNTGAGLGVRCCASQR